MISIGYNGMRLTWSKDRFAVLAVLELFFHFLLVLGSCPAGRQIEVVIVVLFAILIRKLGIVFFLRPSEEAFRFDDFFGLVGFLFDRRRGPVLQENGLA